MEKLKKAFFKKNIDIDLLLVYKRALYCQI